MIKILRHWGNWSRYKQTEISHAHGSVRLLYQMKSTDLMQSYHNFNTILHRFWYNNFQPYMEITENRIAKAYVRCI